jgi:hypothetical protein
MKKAIIFYFLIAIGLTTSNAQVNCTLKVSADSVTDLRCPGNATGAIYLKVVNARAPIVYKWSTGDNTPNAFNLQAGSYKVTVTDSVGCRDSILNIKVSQDTPIINVQTTPATNGTDGKATITITKKASVFSRTFMNLKTGSYNLPIVDAQGCVYSIPVIITGVTGLNDLNTEGLSTFEIVQNTSNSALITIGFNEQKAFDLKILTLSGQEVFNRKFKDKDLLLTLNTSDLPQGLLLFKLTVNDKTLTKKHYFHY